MLTAYKRRHPLHTIELAAVRIAATVAFTDLDVTERVLAAIEREGTAGHRAQRPANRRNPIVAGLYRRAGYGALVGGKHHVDAGEANARGIRDFDAQLFRNRLAYGSR